MSGLKRRPKPPTENGFISGANETPVSITGKKETLPWNELGVREDVIKTFVLRLPEPAFLKLKYIAENSPYSMQSFCHEHLLKAIDDQLKK